MAELDKQSCMVDWFHSLSVGSLARKITHLVGISNYLLKRTIEHTVSWQGMEGYDTMGVKYG